MLGTKVYYFFLFWNIYMCIMIYLGDILGLNMKFIMFHTQLYTKPEDIFIQYF
jgi:hypothetical protein